jgi:hypothetical protein
MSVLAVSGGIDFAAPMALEEASRGLQSMMLLKAQSAKNTQKGSHSH